MFRHGPRRATVAAEPEVKPRICIEGLGIMFDTPILNKHGKTIVFEPKSFDKYFETGARPPFWQSHNENMAFGLNTELCILSEGIAFRLDLTNVKDSNKIQQLIKSGHDGISIGFTEVKTRDEVLFGHPVKMIEEASLREISLVSRGACKQAWCRVIDANNEPPLHESVNSTMFAIEYDLHDMKIKVEDRRSDLESLSARLAALNAGTQYDDRPASRSMSVNESNRRQTDQYDRLAADARSKHVRAI